MFLVDPGHFCGQGATLWCRKPLLSSNNFTEGHLMKIESLVTDVTAIGSPGRAGCAMVGAILGVIVAGRVFGQSRSFLWSRRHFVV